MGSLLVGLPCLCGNGLLSGLERHLCLPSGFYSTMHILVLLGFMALGRIRRPEGLRHVPAGELGKVVGLDRVPEVRTLRKKLEKMATIGSLPEAERPAQLLPMAKPSAHCWPTSQKPPSNTPKPEPEWSIN